MRRAIVTVTAPGVGERTTAVVLSSTWSALGDRRGGSGVSVMPPYDSSSTSASARGDDHGTTGPVFSASWALPPASIAKAVSAPSERSRLACSAAVTPGLPWEGPSAVTSMSAPAAVWPTAEREVRASSCEEV